jgi:hypothetical protein
MGRVVATAFPVAVGTAVGLAALPHPTATAESSKHPAATVRMRIAITRLTLQRLIWFESAISASLTERGRSTADLPPFFGDVVGLWAASIGGRGQHAAPAARSARTNGVDLVRWATQILESAASTPVQLAAGRRWLHASGKRSGWPVAARHPFAMARSPWSGTRQGCARDQSHTRPAPRSPGEVLPIAITRTQPAGFRKLAVADIGPARRAACNTRLS